MSTLAYRMGKGLGLGLVMLIVGGTFVAAAAGNNAAILAGSSSVPGSGGAGATVAVMVRVQNTGATTWTAGAAYRLGASAANQVAWGGYACGGYMNNPTDGRVFLCQNVPPGGTHDFRFNITLPGSGTARLSVQMVQDAVEWFGQTQSWDISVSSGTNQPDVVVDSVRPDPANPQAGQSVQFVSVVRNQGSGPTPSGVVIGVGYFIDGNYVSYGFSSNALAPGASVTITTQGGPWTATSGSHVLMALADDVNRFAESNENNNSRSANFTVGGGCANNPLSTPSDRWKLEIFNNKGLTGSTVEQRYDAAGAGGFTFNWGSGGPSSCAGVDNFGVRFTRTFSVATAGNYTFTATADDGVRVWVDGQLLIDRWIDQAPTTYTATKSLTAGSHDIRMDYYENGGGATATLSWQYSGGGCANNPLSTPSDRWKLEIFNNKALSGSTVEQRYDAAGAGGFTFNWGSGGPSSCAGVDNFGVRFTRTFSVATAGNYTFTATADDGVRVWVDGQLLIDRWIDQAPTTYTATKSLTAGSHDIRMDYYENGGGATAALSWQYSGGGCANNPLSTPSDRWKLEIFNNKALSGSTVEQRYDAAGAGGFTFNWGSGGPSSCAGVDNFGVRFTRTFSVATAGNYTFTATADDGVRLWVDGQLIIDRWIDQAPTTYTATKSLTAGSHDIRMDYYENGGGATAALSWQLQSSGGGELYGMNIDPANPAGNPSSQQLKDAHVRWVRIEWKLNPGYSFYDSRIADYRNAGLKVLLLVDYSSVPGKPASNAPDAAWTAYLQTFNTSLKGIAAHYGDGVDAWQIWNEPDLMAPGTGYDPGVPAGHYGVMLRDSVTAIRAYSSRTIVTGGLASGNADYLAQARNAVGSLTVDVVAVHPYGQRAPDNWPNSSWGFGNMSDLFNRYLAFGKPLWVTESGINDADTSLYAQYLENVYKLARDQYANRVIRVFWFCWSDGMVAPFGVLDANGNPKDTYYRYQSIAPAW